MFTKVLGVFVGLVGVFWLALAGGGAVWWWDRRPQPIVIHTPIPFVSFKLPESLGEQLADYRAADLRAQRRVLVVHGAQVKLNDDIQAGLQKAQDHVRVVTRIIRYKVPVYVAAQDDARCTINTGFVRVFNAAAAGRPLPDVPGRAGRDALDAPSGVSLSAVADATVTNDAAFYTLRNEVTGWRDWYAGQKAAFNLLAPVAK